MLKKCGPAGPIGPRGPTGTGTLDPEQALTLEHWVYDPIEEQLVADVPIVTTLSSLFIGHQHKISSGGDSLMVSHVTNGENHYIVDQGFKNQSVAGNLGKDGVIAPRVAANISDMIDPLASLNLTPDFTGSVEATDVEYFPAQFPSNFWNFGFVVYSAQILEVGDKLKYTIRDADTDVKIYSDSQKITTELPVDFLYDWYFDHPVSLDEGSHVFIDIHIEKANGTITPWFMRPSNEIPFLPWTIPKVRSFDRHEIATLNSFDKVLTHQLDAADVELVDGPLIVVDNNGNLVIGA